MEDRIREDEEDEMLLPRWSRALIYSIVVALGLGALYSLGSCGKRLHETYQQKRQLREREKQNPLEREVDEQEVRVPVPVPEVEERKEQEYETRSEKKKPKYTNFKFREELPVILYTAQRVGIEPELLLAIRMAEQGREGLQFGFGIIPTKAYNKDSGVKENGKVRPYKNKLEKQASWCAWTIKKNRERYEADPKEKDFIDYLGDVYCPVGAENDPQGLNVNWKRNVRAFYSKFNSEK